MAYLPSYYPSYPAIPTLPSYYPYGSVTYGGGYSGCYGYGYGYNSVAVSGPIYTTGYGINAGAPIVCVDRVAAPRTVSVVTGGETTIISSEAVRSNKPVLRTSR